VNELPILDVGPFLRGEPGALDTLAPQLRDACEQLGFYFIVNHGISPALIDEAFDETARFHALPEEEKLKIRQGEHYVGYVPPGGIRINTGDGFDNAKNKADLQSALHVGRDFAPDHPLVQAGVRYYVPQPWPENLPGFKEKVKEYFRAVETLGRRLLPVYAASVEAPLDYFDRAFVDPLDYLRLIYYPATPNSEDQFGLGAHTDSGFLTFLPQTKVPGLEIMLPDGRWVAQPTVPGAFLVNAGQILKRWTNNRFRATPHRVISPKSGEARYSIPFFFNPHRDALIETVPACTSTDRPAIAPIHYWEHLDQYLANTYRN